VQRPLAGAERAPMFEFLEPVVLELKLTNVSGRPQVLPEKLLAPTHQLTVIVKRRGSAAKQIVPFATYCWAPKYKAIAAGESLYESLFASVGRGGWQIAEPGYYTVQVSLHTEKEDIISNPLAIRVAPPRNYSEEYLAQDFFSDGVGRVLTFDGSKVMDSANTSLQEVCAQLPDRKVAVHARVARANAMLSDYKQLEPDGRGIKTTSADLDETTTLMDAVVQAPTAAAEVLGNIDLNYYLTRLSKAFSDAGATREAAGVLDALTTALTERKALPSVVEAISARRAAIKAPASVTPSARAAGKPAKRRR
jgi:hypothetical protein